MRRVLVLGAGQVGTFAARAIEEGGGSVLAADLEPAPEYFGRFGPRGDRRLVRADVCSRSEITGLIRAWSADTVVLCVGVTGRDVSRCWTVNVDGAGTAADAAVELGVERLVFVSSFAVYGRPAVRVISESLPPTPVSDYGRAKVAAEATLASFRARGLDVRVLRPCGLYGPRRPASGSRSAGLIDLLLAAALAGRVLSLPAGIADEYLYVKDLARAIALAAMSEIGSEHFIFNVGSGERTTVQALCTAVRQLVAEAQFTLEPSLEKNHSLRPPLDVSRMRDVFGFAPRYSLVGGLGDYLHRESRLAS